MDLPAAYADLIERFGALLGIPFSLIHVHVGLLIYFGSRLLLRARSDASLPLVIVACAELANETLDRLQYGSWRWPDTTADIVNTLIWPTVIWALARWRIGPQTSSWGTTSTPTHSVNQDGLSESL